MPGMGKRGKFRQGGRCTEMAKHKGQKRHQRSVQKRGAGLGQPSPPCRPTVSQTPPDPRGAALRGLCEPLTVGASRRRSVGPRHLSLPVRRPSRDAPGPASPSLISTNASFPPWCLEILHTLLG